MPVVVTRNPVLLLAGDEISLTLDHPIIGWQNLVNTSNIAANSVDPNHPASNMANPATHLFWRAGAPNSPPDYVYVTITTSGEPVDYVAIARHNLGSAAIAATVGYFTASSPITWVDLVAENLLPHDGPALFRFAEQLVPNLMLRLSPGNGLAQIAVTYAGKLLVLPRKIYQGFAPIPYGRTAKVTNGRSEAGNFLGRIVLQEFVKDTVPLSLIDPAYFRDHIADFLVDSKENPFFFAWRPQTYPDEIGYCHMTNDPLPVNEAPHGLIAMQMEMTGVI